MRAIRQVTPGKPPDNPGGICAMRPTILLTRPQAASDRFATEARAALGADWPVLIAPLMRTIWQGALPEMLNLSDVIFTSETALRGFCRLSARRDMRAWCVGARTATAAERAGFAVCQGPGDAQGLAALIAKTCAAKRLFWPHGTDVARNMDDLLVPAGIETVSAVIYNQQPVPLTAAALTLLSGHMPVLLPLFSPRSARLLLQAFSAHTIRAPLYLASLGPDVDAATAALMVRQRRVAAQPNAKSLLVTLAHLAEIAALG